jgi:hypothetical protein
MNELKDNWLFASQNDAFRFLLNPERMTLNTNHLLELAKDFLVYKKRMENHENVVGQVLNHLDSYRLDRRTRCVVDMVKHIAAYRDAVSRGETLKAFKLAMQFHGLAYLSSIVD